ncbi:hypothetical protein ACV3K4_04370 [Clostridium perfringens]|uniref:hypothetical protein n=1 Tax=Clostridium perfringens TaxID=1502 RepID=UPI002A13AF99|nr:hypothetical protein [Clostridium perfringens]
MQGCFIVSKNEDIEYDIKFSKYSEHCKDGIPKIQMELYQASEEISNVIRRLIDTDKSKKDEYFDKLLSATRAGLVGETAEPEEALKSLDILKNEMIANESGRIKNDYMTKLGKKAFVLILVSLFIVLLINKFNIFYLNKYFFIFQGAMIGTWVSFGARKIELSFEELGRIEVDSLRPLIRLIFIGICSIIVYLFISCGIVSFEIGGFSSDNFTNSIEAQYLLGIICGLLEYKIAINIYNKATNIMKF